MAFKPLESKKQLLDDTKQNLRTGSDWPVLCHVTTPDTHPLGACSSLIDQAYHMLMTEAWSDSPPQPLLFPKDYKSPIEGKLDAGKAKSTEDHKRKLGSQLV